jgi:hypothetical protein
MEVTLDISKDGNMELLGVFMKVAINKGPELDKLFASIWEKDKRVKTINKETKGFTYTWEDLNREQVGFLKGILMTIKSQYYCLMINDEDPEILGDLM